MIGCSSQPGRSLAFSATLSPVRPDTSLSFVGWDKHVLSVSKGAALPNDNRSANLVAMRYRRANIVGGIYFFTVNLAELQSALLVDRVENLRTAVRLGEARHLFDILAWATLPDHLHAIWQVPSDDAGFLQRGALIKADLSRRVKRFTRAVMAKANAAFGKGGSRNI